MSILLLVMGLLMFIGLVVWHELGHFLAARRNGVEVEEFGIGFPPRAKVLGTRKGTVITWNWLPLGGFVKLKGEHDADQEPGSFGAASLRAKLKIMLAGVVMNLAAGFVLLTASALVGMPQLIPSQFTVASDSRVVRQDVYVAYVEAGSPADKAGLKQQDRLISLAFKKSVYKIDTADRLPLVTKLYANRPVKLTVESSGQTRTVSLNLRSQADVEASQNTDNPKGYLGVAPTEFTVRRSTWSAPLVALGVMKQFTVETLKGIGTALGGLASGDVAKASEQVSGPVGVVVLLKDGSLLGPEFILFIIAALSLMLAIMNVLPIPALDGGRLFVTLLYRVLRKPLSPAAEDRIHGIGFAVLIILFILITIKDVKLFW